MFIKSNETFNELLERRTPSRIYVALRKHFLRSTSLKLSAVTWHVFSALVSLEDRVLLHVLEVSDTSKTHRQ